MAKNVPSRYAQLKRIAVPTPTQKPGNVVPLAAAHPWRPNVTRNDHAASGATLYVEPTLGEIYDVSFLLALPNLWKPFAEALLAKFCKADMPERSSRKVLATKLRCHLTRYLVESGRANLTLEEMRTETVNGYVAWLTSVKVHGKLLAANTRSTSLTALRTIVDELRSHPAYKHRVPKALSVPVNPWPGSFASRTPTSVLADEDWLRLYIVCAEVVSHTIEEITRQWREVEELIGSVSLNESPKYYKCEKIFLASLATAFPGSIPKRKVLYSKYPNIAQALFKWHSSSTFRALNPFPCDLVPFIVLLQIYTNFNADPLLRLELTDIAREVVMGVERVVLSPYKARARRRQVRSFAVSNDPTSPSSILDFIVEWTSRIRVEAPPKYRNRLFLYTPQVKARSVRSFGEGDGPASLDQTFRRNLHQFLESHGLPATNMMELRATGLEFVHQLFSGDLRAVQAAGGQRRPQVINDHYTSDAARRRNDERLANVMATHERWQESDGRSDPRGSPDHQDLGACTPGWICADPYDSPIPGERKGRLCAAFGACPGCPLASVDTTAPSALANLLALKAEIEGAQAYLPARRWVDAWAPRLARLNNYWLPAFQNPAVLDAAARLTPPRFPRLD